MKGPRRQDSDVGKALDDLYREWDASRLRRTQSIRLIPGLSARTRGRAAYGEWAHVAGVFQALLAIHTGDATDLQLLDVGCGNGAVAIAAEPFVGGSGRYVGIDVSAESIELCRRTYPSPPFEFHHVAAGNAAYAPDQGGRVAWDLPDRSFDAVTALSVWTHLKEEDARFYLDEVGRVLSSDGVALITFFVIDGEARQGPGERSSKRSRFHGAKEDRWVFDTPADDGGWFSTRWAKVPESAIGVERAALDSMVASAGLRVRTLHPGTWRERPGPYFQDVVVLERSP